jgi:hypothetical protein
VSERLELPAFLSRIHSAFTLEFLPVSFPGESKMIKARPLGR